MKVPGRDHGDDQGGIPAPWPVRDPVDVLNNVEGGRVGQFDVEPSELRSAAKKIRDSVGKSDKVKLDELGDTSGDFGHGDAAKEFGELMATWMEAIKSPMKEDGENSAEKLDENAASYERAEQRAQNHFTGSAVGSGPSH
jgi:uncharacterized protein YukE